MAAAREAVVPDTREAAWSRVSFPKYLASREDLNSSGKGQCRPPGPRSTYYLEVYLFPGVQRSLEEEWFQTTGNESLQTIEKHCILGISDNRTHPPRKRVYRRGAVRGSALF